MSGGFREESERKAKAKTKAEESMVIRDSRGKRRKVAKGTSNISQRAVGKRPAGEVPGESKLQEQPLKVNDTPGGASAPPMRKKVKK